MTTARNSGRRRETPAKATAGRCVRDVCCLARKPSSRELPQRERGERRLRGGGDVLFAGFLYMRGARPLPPTASPAAIVLQRRESTSGIGGGTRCGSGSGMRRSRSGG